MSKNVLVVEDLEDQNKFICNIVEKGGYTPIPAYSGTQGFDMLRKYRRGLGFLTPNISAILLDINMPDMSGLEFLHILRREESWKFFMKHIPVIVLTAHDTEINRDKTTDVEYGMAAKFIVKPFDRQQLLDALHNAIEQKDAETMIEVNRESHYKRFQQEEQSYKDIRHAYLTGVEDNKALDYLRLKMVEAQRDLEEAQLARKASEQTLKHLRDKVQIATSEYDSLSKKVGATGEQTAT